MVLQAPVAICILKGKGLVIESVNEMMLQVWGKTNAVIDKPIREALPELEGNGCLEVMAEVYNSGNKFSGNELSALFSHNGQLKEYFLNLMIKPIRNDMGNIVSIMAIAIDVTEQVMDRNTFDNTLELLKFSVEAANIGTWSKDLQSGDVNISERHKELFGFTSNQHVDTGQLMMQIPPEQREQVAKEMARVYTEGGLYDITFSTEGFEDQKVRWVRALGSVIRNSKGIPSYFSGVSIETTQQKEDELRKNHFISIVSHELKTPLTSLKGYIQLLMQTADPENKYVSAMLAKAEIKLDKMTSLINGFLNVSQLESGKIKLDIQKFELNELIREVADEMNFHNKNGNIIYTLQEMTLLEADREKIGQVIVNLLNNASKYSESDSPVYLQTRLHEGILSLSVRDTGIGITPEDQLLIFERYFRVNSTQNEFISGFGIGLYLCREIIQRHQGTITVQSIPEKGSVFTFSLPVSIY